MTVAELIALLQQQDLTLTVLVEYDGRYSPPILALMTTQDRYFKFAMIDQDLPFSHPTLVIR